MIKRAVLYARVSTDEQADKGYSLPTQLAAMREYAARNGLKVAGEYADDCSGSIPIRERPQGKKIYELVEHIAIEAVVLFTHDRTARDELVIEYLLFKSYLYERGVELHYADNGLDPYTMEGNLVGYIKAHAASDERKKIRERSVRGRNAKAQDNKLVMSGSPPFGIRQEGRRDQARWVLDDTDIHTVKLIFDWFKNGDKKRPALPLRGIAIKLEKLKIPPPHCNRNAANHWIPTTVRNILMNEIYTGRTYYGKTRMVNGQRVKQPRDKWIQIDVPELAVIDRETFDAVQEQLKQNQIYARRNARHEYLLTGFATCGGCSRAVCGSVINSWYGKKKYPYPAYRCAKHWSSVTEVRCPNRNHHIVAHIADDAVWGWVTKLLTDEATLDEGLREMAARNLSEIEPHQARLEEITKLIEQTKPRIDRLVKALSDADDEDVAGSIEAQIKNLKKQRDGLKIEKKEVEAKLAQVQVTPDLQARIRKQAAAIRAKLTKPSFERKRQLFRDLNLKVVFNFKANGERWLDASCELHPESESIVLNPS